MSILGSIPSSSNLSEDYIILQIYKHEPEEVITSLKTEIQNFLLKKYQPLCNSLSSRYRYLDSFDDNKQECYFSMLKALDYVNLSKIGSTKDFSFGYYFKTYIQMDFNNKSNSKEQKEKDATFTISDIVKVDEEGNEIDSVLFQQKDAVDNIICEDAWERFKQTLSPHKRTVIERVVWERYQKEAAEKLGLTPSSLSIHLKKIRREFIDYMNKNGYKIAVAQ